MGRFMGSEPGTSSGSGRDDLLEQFHGCANKENCFLFRQGFSRNVIMEHRSTGIDYGPLRLPARPRSRPPIVLAAAADFNPNNVS